MQVRVPTTVVSSICDDRGEEPTYAGVTMSTLITGDYNVGDVISLLWFKRQLPKYATRFIEMCVMLCADHGPCVSGSFRKSATPMALASVVYCKKGRTFCEILSAYFCQCVDDHSHQSSVYGAVSDFEV